MYVNSITRGIITITIFKIIDKLKREKTRSGIQTLWTLKATTINHSKVNTPRETH